jgi:hypothetical protein
MQRHWDNVTNTMHALVSILKTIDPDGVDLYYTSNASSPAVKIKNVAGIHEPFQQNRPKTTSCKMELALNHLINSLIPSDQTSNLLLVAFSKSLVPRRQASVCIS